MNQFGFVARIALIVTAALFLGQMAVVASYVWQLGRSPLPPYAIADRLVAAVQVFDGVPPELRPQAIALASASGFDVSVESGTPANFEEEFAYARMRVLAQNLLNDYAPGRIVRAGTLQEGKGDRIITFVTELKTGESAVFSVSDNTTLRIWNMPIGFIAGFFGICVALLAVLAVARETRPLVDLAHSIDELGNRVAPVEVRERGAKELRTLIRAINNMQGRILGLVNNRTLFLGAISHDLKTYLTRFRLRLEVMPASTHRDKAIRDVEGMEQLLGDVLLFASETGSDSRGDIVEFNGAVAHRVADMDPEGHRLSLSPAPEDLLLMASMTTIGRVVDNLLSNALRYGDRANVIVTRKQDMAMLLIEDDGPGIGDDELALVFEPFFRGEPSRNRNHGGTGLGLAIARQIVNALGGTIELENRRDADGLRVTVLLPLAGIKQPVPVTPPHIET